MMHTKLNHWLAVLGALLLSSLALAQTAVSFDLPAQPLAASLKAIANQTNTNVLFNLKEIQNLEAPPIKAQLTPEQAIAQLLNGTPFTHQIVNEHTIVVRKDETKLSTAKPALHTYRLADDSSSSTAGSTENTNSQTSDTKPGKQIEEIVVTAQKRVERLRDVPVPVTAIDASALADGNQVRLQDYFTSAPGLNVMPSVQSSQTLSIRGITTGIGNPTVAVMIDGVPFGASTNNGGGRVVPDIDPGDLARVEVLRGPQGSLYGAGSLGGLLNFVTRDPSAEGVSGRLQAGMNSVENGDEFGYNVRGSVNVPLGDTLAIRASGFTRRDAGYVENIRGAEEGANSADAYGGRLAALWRASDSVSLDLSALLQEIKGNGSSSVDPLLGDLRQDRIPDSGGYRREVQAYSATLAVDFGSVDLTAISGYGLNVATDSLDTLYNAAVVAQAQSTFGVAGADTLSKFDTEKFSQEIRLTGAIGQRFQWLLGGFYTNEDSEVTINRLAVNPITGADVGRLLNSHQLDSFEELAAFANLTVNFTDRIDVQFGVRQSNYEETFDQTNINQVNVATISPQLSIDSDALTYLITPRFRVTPNLMMYARLASGYRVGGPNPFPGGIVPLQYQPDETRNYEIGVKGDFLNRALTVDASLYYIDWKDIQFSARAPASTYFTNGSRAKSEGVELSMESRPLTGLTISGWVAFNKAELTESFPTNSTGFGLTGDRLPMSARHSGYLSVEQEIPFRSELRGFAGASVTHVGDRIGPFQATAQRQLFPSYEQVDLRAGVRKDTWAVNFFVTNLDDKRGALYGGIGALPPTAFQYIQPRTFGFSLSKTY